MKNTLFFVFLFLVGNTLILTAQDKVYRADNRPPDTIKAHGGFVPRGMMPGQSPGALNYHIASHQEFAGPHTAFVSTSASIAVATQWTTHNNASSGYVYVISPTPNFIPVNPTLRQYSKYPTQQEFMSMGIIDWRQVQGWYPVVGGTRQAYQANPDYDQSFDRLGVGDPAYALAGFPDYHIAWTKDPWNSYSNCRERRFGGDKDDPGSCSGGSSAVKRSVGNLTGDCLPLYCNDDFRTDFDANSQQLVLRNLNYSQLYIQMGLDGLDKYFYLNSGEDTVLVFDPTLNEYTFNGQKVNWINLDYGNNTGGNGASITDQHDNIYFSYYTQNNTITYKPKNGWTEELLIKNYKNAMESQYFETFDEDGINQGSGDAIVKSYGVGNTQFIEICRNGTNKFDPTKLQRIYFTNATYANLPKSRIRKKQAWDYWPIFRPVLLSNGAPTAPEIDTLKMTYHGNGVVKHSNDVVQQIDLYNTDPAAYYSGDEFDFEWTNAQQINYRPYWYLHPGPRQVVYTLVDFTTGYYKSFVDHDGFAYTGGSNAYIRIRLVENGEALCISLIGSESNVHVGRLKRDDSYLLVQNGLRTKTDQQLLEVAQEALTSMDALNTSSTNLDVYPNPVLDQLTLEFSAPSNLSSIEIYASDGKLLLQKDWKTTMEARWHINVSKLPTGIYLLKARTDQEVYLKKFVK